MTWEISVFQFIVLIFSVMIHEISHGLMAEKLGDPTARLAGRITLNPIKHIDIFGSIILPLILVLTNSPIILGWAKPVPYNPNVLPDPKIAGGKIAAAGPLSNFFLAAVFALIMRIAVILGASQSLIMLFAIIVVINLALGIFNLVPIPPLDGSKVLYSFLPGGDLTYRVMGFLERYGIILIFAFLWMAGSVLSPIISWFFQILTGFSFG